MFFFHQSIQLGSNTVNKLLFIGGVGLLFTQDGKSIKIIQVTNLTGFLVRRRGRGSRRVWYLPALHRQYVAEPKLESVYSDFNLVEFFHIPLSSSVRGQDIIHFNTVTGRRLQVLRNMFSALSGLVGSYIIAFRSFQVEVANSCKLTNTDSLTLTTKLFKEAVQEQSYK